MRVLAYTDYVYRRCNGTVHAERAFALFLVALARRVDHLTVAGRLTDRTGATRYRLPPEVGFVALPPYERLDRPFRALPAMARSIRAFSRALPSADVVWLLGPSPLALGFAALSRARGRAVVLGVRQDLPRYVAMRHPRRPGLRLAALALEAAWQALARRRPVVVVGPDLAHRYRRSRSVLEIAVSLVPRAQVLDGERAYGGCLKGTVRVLSVGRLDREKNPLLLADVLARLRARDPRWHLVVCGDGPLTGALERRLAELGLSDHAELRGYVPVNGGLPELYRESDLFLHLSWTEGLPQVLFEAFATALPTVATAVGGVAGAAHGAAVLIPPGDCEAAALALEALAGDCGLRTRLVRAGLERARARTLESETERVAELLRAAAMTRGGHSRSS